jgi:hypothetical protein
MRASAMALAQVGAQALDLALEPAAAPFLGPAVDVGVGSRRGRPGAADQGERHGQRSGSVDAGADRHGRSIDAPGGHPL